MRRGRRAAQLQALGHTIVRVRPPPDGIELDVWLQARGMFSLAPNLLGRRPPKVPMCIECRRPAAGLDLRQRCPGRSSAVGPGVSSSCSSTSEKSRPAIFLLMMTLSGRNFVSALLKNMIHLRCLFNMLKELTQL